ncbi:MAG: FG-GAP-like repeat-containing protein, partial [Patescibacteria group bacterium]
MRRVSIFILPALAVMVGFPSAVFAIGERMPEVRIYNAETGAEETRFPVLDGKFKGGISVAAGDVDGDGVDEIVVGAGPGGGPTVMVYEKDGTRRSNFMAYDANTKKGVSLAVGDVDGNGTDEIWTAPMMGQAHIRAFDFSGTPLFITKGFFAFPDWMKGGASLAIGDVQGDGVREVYVSAGSVTSGHIRSFSRTGSVVGWSLMPFGAAHQGGAVVRLANMDAEKGDEVIAGNYDQGESRVKI